MKRHAAKKSCSIVDRGLLSPTAVSCGSCLCLVAAPRTTPPGIEKVRACPSTRETMG